MMYIVDRKTDDIIFQCPQCGKKIHVPAVKAAYLAEQAGGCRDCRAKRTLTRHPELASLFRDFWLRSGVADGSFTIFDEVEEAEQRGAFRRHEENIIPFRLPSSDRWEERQPISR